MAKLSLTELKAAVADIVTTSKVSTATFSVTRDNIVGLVDKIGKIVTIDNVYTIDKLARFDGEYLSYGKTVEDWFQDLIMPVAYNEAASPYGNYKPSYRPAYYSYTLGKKLIPTTIPNNDVERAVHFSEQLAEIVAIQVKRLSDSMAQYRYGLKKGMLGTLAKMCILSSVTPSSFSATTAYTAGAYVYSGTTVGKVLSNIASSSSPGTSFDAQVTAGNIAIVGTTENTSKAIAGSGKVYPGQYINYSTTRHGVVVKEFTQSASSQASFDSHVASGDIINLSLVSALATPSDSTTAKAFIKQVKNDVEIANDVSEGHSLNGNTVGATSGLTLIMKQGIASVLDVETDAGAFHLDKVAIPADIIVVNDLPCDIDSGVYAILIDSRGMRLHNTYDATRENLNGAADWLNLFRHTEDTAYISRNTFVKVYTSTGA